MFTGIFFLIVIVQSITQIDGATKPSAEDKIIFPGPIKELTLNRYGGGNSDKGSQGEVPDECRHKNYCTVKPPNYPQQKFDTLIKHRIPLNQPMLDGLEDKQGDPDEVDNCESLVEFEPLYKVKSETGWRTVVQSPVKNFVQLVRLETCRSPMAACFTVFPKLPTYTTFCKQKYTTWHFVVDVDEPGVNKTETIPVDLPTCCSCFYKPV